MNKSEQLLSAKRIEGQDVQTYTYTINNGKLIKTGYRIFDRASMYPSLLKGMK